MRRAVGVRDVNLGGIPKKMAMDKSGVGEITGKRVWNRKREWRGKPTDPPPLKESGWGRGGKAVRKCYQEGGIVLSYQTAESSPGCGWRSNAGLRSP